MIVVFYTVKKLTKRVGSPVRPKTNRLDPRPHNTSRRKSSSKNKLCYVVFTFIKAMVDNGSTITGDFVTVVLYILILTLWTVVKYEHHGQRLRNYRNFYDKLYQKVVVIQTEQVGFSSFHFSYLNQAHDQYPNT